MKSHAMRRASLGCGAVLVILLTAACDPPGKPPSQEQTPNVAEEKIPYDFKTLFAQNCAACHGQNGRQGPGRVLNDPLYLAVSSKEIIRKVLTNGRAGGLMPPFAASSGGPLSDKQMDILIDGMYSNWAKPFDFRGTPKPSYDEAGIKGDVTHGRKLFLKDCYACHAQGGVVGAVNDKAFLSLSTNQNLRTSIIVGRPDYPGIQMPNYLMLNAGRPLSDQDIGDIVSFLASLRPSDSLIGKLEASNQQGNM